MSDAKQRRERGRPARICNKPKTPCQNTKQNTNTMKPRVDAGKMPTLPCQPDI
jgi:hypothetical protein